MELENAHIVITGAGQRVGRAIAENLLADPIKLTAHYFRSEKQAQELVLQARSRGRKCQALRADLRNPSEIVSFAAQAENGLGPIHILINCASTFYATPWELCDEAAWEDILDTNLKGPFFLALACAKRMARPGLILNIADAYGKVPLKSHAPYGISKAGVLMMTQCLALELAPHIRVHSISPGPVLPRDPDSSTEKERLKTTVLGRFGTPDDISEGIRFLISNDYLTGQDLAIDGGRSLGGHIT